MGLLFPALLGVQLFRRLEDLKREIHRVRDAFVNGFITRISSIQKR
jgi:hypothetical protein